MSDAPQDNRRYRVRALVELEIDHYALATGPSEAIGLVKTAITECVYGQVGPGGLQGTWSEVDVEQE